MGFLDDLGGRLEALVGETFLPDDVRELLARGEEALAAGRLDDAVEHFENACARRPDLFRTQMMLGLARERRGDLRRAVLAYERAIKAREEIPALLGLARVKRALGEVQGALSAVKRAIALDPRDPELASASYQLAGELYLETGRPAKAARDLRKARAHVPAHDLARADLDTLLGTALVARGEVDEARAVLSAAAGAVRPSARALVSLAQLELDAATADPHRRRQRLQASLAAAHAALERVTTGEGTPSAGRARLELEIDARAVLVKALVADGNLTEAYPQALQGIALAPPRVDLRVSLGRLRLQSGELSAAAEELVRAAGLAPDDPQVGVEAAEVLAQAGRAAEAAQLLDRLTEAASRSGSPSRGWLRRLWAERGLVAVRLGEPAAARELFDRVLSRPRAATSPDEVEAAAGTASAGAGGAADGALFAAHLGMGELLLGSPDLAVRELRRARILRPENPAARELLGRAYLRDAQGGERPAADLHRMAAQVHRFLLSSPLDPPSAAVPQAAPPAPAPTADEAGASAAAEVVPIEPPPPSRLSDEAQRAAVALGEPLLVCVMGEFNSGKSTFVNALLGEDVAAMGVTPTTATCNVLRYGPERAGRIIYRDGSVRDVPFGEIAALTGKLEPAEAVRILRVEIFAPVEELLRMQVVDTPGLNSLLPEHEQVARGFVAEADAVIWLFSVDQAAKDSERRALEFLAGHGPKILGVVNKIDRAAPDDAAKVLGYVRERLANRVDGVVAVSARQALQARKSGASPEAAAELQEKSGFAGLRQLFEERLLARARVLKQTKVRERLARLLSEAESRCRRLDEGRQAVVQELGAIRERLRMGAERFRERFMVAETDRLRDDEGRLYHGAARELLDIVRPLKGLLREGGLTRADELFFLDLLEERMEELCARSAARAWGEVELLLYSLKSDLSDALQGKGGGATGEAGPGVVAGDPLGGGDELEVVDATFGRAQKQLLREQVYGRYLAFFRGHLHGRAETFFRRTLPRLEIDEDSIYRALTTAAPDFDEELLRPLTRWLQQFSAELEARLRHVERTAQLAVDDVELRYAAPARALREALGAAG
jgi:tetratricopeptide (TPR) repeat protein/GTP-binding protein EngB required for normal cell division